MRGLSLVAGTPPIPCLKAAKFHHLAAFSIGKSMTYASLKAARTIDH
jgi:hypothetical protein